jgi:integrase
MNDEPTRLTRQVAEECLPKEKRYVRWDSELKGFGLRVEPKTGSRSWIVKYRAGHGRQAPVRWLVLGPYPRLSPNDARAAARATLADATLGRDPAGARAAKRKEMTVAELVDEYEKNGCYVQRGIRQGQAMKPLTKKYTMARLRHHVVPLLGKRRVTEVHEGDIERLARDITAGKTAKDEKVAKRKRIIVKGGDGAARKVVRDLSAVFAWAQGQRIVAANPVATAKVRKTDNRREGRLKGDEFSRFGAALIALEAEGANKKALTIIRLLLLTGARRNEIASLKWSEVDFEGRRLLLEDTKTGASERPVSRPALAILKALDDARDPLHDDWVFPAEWGDSHFQGVKKVFAKALQKAGLAGVTLHGLRHSVGAQAASSGESLLIVGTLLGHKNTRSSSIYAHVEADPARLAADRVIAPIAAALGLVTPSAPEPPAAANDEEPTAEVPAPTVGEQVKLDL